MGETYSYQKTIFNGQKGDIKFISGQMQGQFFHYSGWRLQMEDTVIHELDIGFGNSLFAVFDGHAGSEVSKYVADIFISVLKSSPEYQKKDYVKAFDWAFKTIDEKIDSEEGSKVLKDLRDNHKNKTYQPQDNISSRGGCTANVVLITPQKYVIANIGDSRSFLCRQGKNVAFSQDHKPQVQEQQKRIKKAVGSIQLGRINGGLNLTRSFGDFDYKRNKDLSYSEQMVTCKPSIRQIQRSPQDQFIIIGSDGIWERYVQNSQGLIDLIKDMLKKQRNLQNVIKRLLDDLVSKQVSDQFGLDNMSAIIVTLK